MLDSLVRVSRRVGGIADLLTTEMRAAPAKTLTDRARSNTRRAQSQEPGARGARESSANFTPVLSPFPAVRRVRTPRSAAGKRARQAGRVLADPPPASQPTAQPESRRPTSRLPPFTSTQFHVLLNSLFKVLFNFPSRYLFAIGLEVIFSLTRSLPRTLSCTPKQLDSRDSSALRSSHHTGLSPSTGRGPSQGGLGLGPTQEQDYPEHYIPHRPRPGSSVLGCARFTRRY